MVGLFITGNTGGVEAAGGLITFPIYSNSIPIRLLLRADRCYSLMRLLAIFLGGIRDPAGNPVADPTRDLILCFWDSYPGKVRFLHHGFSHQSTTWLEVIYTHTAIEILFADRKCHWLNESTLCSLVAWD